MLSKPVYTLRPGEVFQILDTSPQGIQPSEVALRRELYGENIISTQPRCQASIHLRKKWLSYTWHPFAILLWVAGSIAFVVRQPALGVIIWILVLVNAGFSFIREHRTEQAMQALQKLLPLRARVIRGGVEISLPAQEIVPGDMLILAEGDQIPADARVVEEFGLRINTATLTGDTVPSHKSADASLREGISELERPNLVFAGTSVVSGTGRAVVYATGMLTQFGRIAHLTQTVREESGPLQVELARLTRQMTIAAILIGCVIFLVGFLEIGMSLFEAFLLSLGSIVAIVPEGLPATLTFSLAMAGQRLAQRGVLVKKLSVIETLGSLSTICTDKSGTLTQNQMTVREIWTGKKRFQVSGVGYTPQGTISPNPQEIDPHNDLQALLTAAYLCNNSRLSQPTQEKPYWTCLGDQTEAALRVAAIKGGLDEKTVMQALPRVHELPFEARRKRMSTIHRWQPDVSAKIGGAELFFEDPQATGDPTQYSRTHEIAFVKGAAREVLALCTHIRLDGSTQPLDQNLMSEVLVVHDEYASKALRVLALAYRDLPPRTSAYSTERIEHELTFLGLAAMHDPARPEVAEAIRVCKQASIRIVIVTGDYGLTAEALARRVGILDTATPSIITGAELDEMDETELQRQLDQEVIFARMAPEHKLRVVTALQNRGEVVAVTGDGVNDAPALRKADIGVAMGVIGTDVAKEAADLVLTNDNFASLVSAIAEGRTVYENLRKALTYIFSSNIAEIAPFVLTALTNLPLALTATQILAIDLGTDMLPGLALGIEKPEPDIMRHPPRRRTQHLVTHSLLQRAFLWLGPLEALLAYSGFFLVYALYGSDFQEFLHLFFTGGLHTWFETQSHPLPYHLLAVTIFHAGVVMAQIGNALTCRTETNRGRTLGWFSNRFLWIGIAIAVAMILILIYTPLLARVFGLVHLPAALWLWILLYAPALYALDWIRKWLLRHRKRVPGPAGGRNEP